MGSVEIAENVVESIWDYTPLRLVSFDSDHGMGLSASSLTIGKDGAVITIHDRFYEWKGTFIIDPSLAGVLVVNSIIGKGPPGIRLLFIWLP